MNKKILTLSLMAMLPISAMAMGVQDQPATTSAKSTMAQPPMHNDNMKGHKDWNRDNKFDEAFKNHPLSADQKQKIKSVMEQSRNETKQKVGNILTPEQKQDWTNYEQSHRMAHANAMGNSQPVSDSDDSEK